MTRSSYQMTSEISPGPWEPSALIGSFAIMTGAPWTGQAVAAIGTAAVAAAEKIGRAAVSIGKRAHEALHTVHLALHNHVREPVINSIRTAWNWLTGR